jgi:hypothetical protein
MSDYSLRPEVKDRKTGKTKWGASSRMDSANSVARKSEKIADKQPAEAVRAELKVLKREDHLDRGDAAGMKASLLKRRGKQRK